MSAPVVAFTSVFWYQSTAAGCTANSILNIFRPGPSIRCKINQSSIQVHACVKYECMAKNPSLITSLSIKPSSSRHLLCQAIPTMLPGFAPRQFSRKSSQMHILSSKSPEITARNPPKTFIQPPTCPVRIKAFFIFAARNGCIRMPGTELSAERVYHACDESVLGSRFVHHVAVSITSGRLGSLRIIVVVVIATLLGALALYAAPRRLRHRS